MNILHRNIVNKAASLLFIFIAFYSIVRGEIKPVNDSLVNKGKDAKKLIVFSAGNQAFQIFTEDLYQQLKTDLVPFNLATRLIYLGNNSSDAMDNLERSLMREQYDAFIILDFNYIKRSFVNFGPPGAIPRKEKLRVFYFDESNFLAPLWEIELKVNIDTIKPSDYKNISHSLIVHLREDGIIKKTSQ